MRQNKHTGTFTHCLGSEHLEWHHYTGHIYAEIAITVAQSMGHSCSNRDVSFSADHATISDALPTPVSIPLSHFPYTEPKTTFRSPASIPPPSTAPTTSPAFLRGLVLKGGFFKGKDGKRQLFFAGKIFKSTE